MDLSRDSTPMFDAKLIAHILEVERFPCRAAPLIRLTKIKKSPRPELHTYDAMVKSVYEQTHSNYNLRLSTGFRLLNAR